MKVCKNCGELNTNDCEFCCHCGQSEFLSQEEVVCSRCGASNDKSFDYCINCGNRLLPVSNVSTLPFAQSSLQNVSSAVGAKEQSVNYKNDISATQETAKCPVCGSAVPIHAIFCQRCGKNIAELHEKRIVKRKICPHCGRPNSLDAQLCSYCFCTLANARLCEMQVVHNSKELGDGSVKQVLLASEQGKVKICSGCGTLNRLDEVFCANCGLKLDVELQKKYCPNCGAENPIEGVFCTKCQWSFDGTVPNTVEKWLCRKCQTPNDSKHQYCMACGTKKSGKGGKK